MVCLADNPTLDATSYPYVGVKLSHFSAASPKQNINVVDIDLAAPGIQFRVTPKIEGLPDNSSGTPYTVTRQFTLDSLNSQGAQIAIDASRYWPTTDGSGTLDGSGTPVNLEGVVASAGSVYESFFNAWRAPPPPGISWPALNIGLSNQVAILYGDPADPLGHRPLPEVDDNDGHRSLEPPMALWNTVSGNYQVVSNGIPITPDRLFLANDLNPNPRTGIGFTTNNHLILVAVDGGGSPWFGMRVTELGWFMATNVGVFNAINADGGGSTTLAIATPEPHLVNFPSSGPIGRAVGSNLGVFAVPAYAAITNIADGSAFTAPSEIDIAADVLDSVGSVTNVAFFASGSLLGTVASRPFTLAWPNPSPGSYGLQALAMDNAGLNTTSTVVNIIVSPGESSTVSLAGTVAYYPTNYPPAGLAAERVQNVTMSLTGNANLSVITPADGSYALSNIWVGGTYCVTPSKTDDSPTANGIDSFDQTLIQRHILNRVPDPLDSPYKLLAADVDGSGQIDSFDQTLIQRLILGRDTQFPAGLWRFVPADYVFPEPETDPQTPWDAPTNAWYTNLVVDVTNGDFIAIKLGDVDDSWTAPSTGQGLLAKSAQVLQTRAKSTVPEVVFAVNQQSAQRGQTANVGVSVSGFRRVTSAQFSLGWDPAALRYMGTGSYGLQGLSPGSFGTVLAESGKLAFAWYDPEAVGVTLADGTVLFSVSFEVIGKVGSVPAVALAGAPTAQEVSVDIARAAFRAQDGNVSVAGPGMLLSNSGYAYGAFRLSVPTEKGRSYILEFTDALAPPNWTALPAVVGDGMETLLTDPAATNQQRFYRVRVE